MHRWGVAALLTLLAGCASTKYGRAVDAVKLAMHGRHPEVPSAAAVNAKPYFQMQAVSPDGSAVLIFGGAEGDLQGWYGSGGDALFLDHGLVVRTIGLRGNLDDTRWPAGNPFRDGLQHLEGAVETTRIVDWSPGYRYGITATSRLVPARMESVSILGTVHQLRRIDETLSVPEVGFVAQNTYWVDPSDGFVWRSHQVIAPGFPLDLLALRPYRGGKP